MITLNLLPPIKKQEIRLTQFYILIKNLIILILILIIFTAIVLLLTKFALQNHFAKVVDQNTLTTKYAKLFNKDIREFNQKLEAVGAIQKNYTSWSTFFVDFTKLIPNEIKLETLTVNQDKILITGKAITRDGLLVFKSNLENSDLFFEVVAPLESLLQKDNVDFSIKASINLIKLKNNGD